MNRIREEDTRPAYRGGGYGFISGQQGSGRRRAWWEEEGGLISQAREGQDRGKGIPRTEEERRQRHEELFPGTSLPERGTGIGIRSPSRRNISADEDGPAKTVGMAILAGLGLGIGLFVVNKLGMKM